MRHTSLHTLIFMIMIPSAGLTAQELSDGVYLLSGQEMVAAFKFSEDHKFEFYFSYGAVDRSAHGHYTLLDGKIHLQSDKTGGKDFTITSRKKAGEGTTIRITDPTSALIKEIVCTFKKGTKIDLQYTDEKGEAHSNLDGCDSILLLHPLYPDIPTVIIPGAGSQPDNDFECTLNPSLAECSFHNITLLAGKDSLTPSQPLPYLYGRDRVVFLRQDEK